MPPRVPRILLIDDDPVVRCSAAEVLTAEGYVVLEAAGGAEGIGMALRWPPDLVLCDLLMPGVDGFAVLARLRAEPATASVPFLFITSSTDLGDSRVGYMLGADDYINKPLVGDDLVALVARRLVRGAG